MARGLGKTGRPHVRGFGSVGTRREGGTTEIDQHNLRLFEDVRQKCREDFFYFIDFILKPICPGGEFDLSHAEHFHQMYRLLNADPNFTLSAFGEYSLATDNQYHNRKLGMLPRYHGKTRVGTVAYVMWELLKDPNQRILIISEIWDNARAMLRMIKDLYIEIRNTKDTELAYIYHVMGDWKGEPWNEDDIVVRPRTKKGTDPSVATAGMEREVTSKHFDIIVCDDLLGETNTKTPEQIKKSIRHFSSLTEVGDVQGEKVTKYIIWGTAWDYADLYAMIINKLKSQYDILKLRCWDDDKCVDPKQVLFPEKFTLSYLKSVYKQKMETGDPDSFYKQYLNEPMPKGKQPFPVENIQWFDLSDVDRKALTVVISVDPAFSQNEWSDFTAIVAVGLDNAGRRYVLDIDKFQEKDAAMLCGHIIKMAKKYWQNPTHKLLTVGIEKGFLKNTLEPHLLKFAPWMPIEPLDHGNEDKTQRIINSLQPFVATRRVYLQRWMTELMDQMFRFPKSNLDRDVLDALAYHVQLVPVWNLESSLVDAPPTMEALFKAQLTANDYQSDN